MEKKELKKILDAYTKDVKREVTKAVVKEVKEESNRHLGVLSEDFQAKIDLVVEQFKSQNKKIDSNTQMIGALAENVSIIKENVEFIKGGLSRKVEYEEYLALERRVTAVEKKVR